MKSNIHFHLLNILSATSLAMSISIVAVAGTPPSKTAPSPKHSPAAQVTPPTSLQTPAKSTQTTKSPPPLVLVPPLNPATLKNFTNLYGQLLEVKFTANQHQKIQQRLNKEWMTNLVLRNIVVQTIALEPQILRGTPVERSQLQTNLVENLRQQVLDGDTDALWLLSFYDASPKNWLAPGQPPLTRMTSDMSTEALCFMVNEVMGKSVVTADSKLKKAIAIKLTAEYANVPVNNKQELSKLPVNWLKFKENDWFRRGEDFREQMRVYWGQNLEKYIPELREISKLRRDRLAKLKADPTAPWDKINPIQRQAALQKSDVDFQNIVRTLTPVTTIQLNNYIAGMEVASAIGSSPTRNSLKLKIK